MLRKDIENEARRVQFEIWSQRKLLWSTEPCVPAMFEPRVVAEFNGLSYEQRESIGAFDSRTSEAAGILNRRREIISVSSRFSYEVQRFTAAHELGHFFLHPEIGYEVEHRDRPIYGMSEGRPQHEADADYFAACLLVPRKALVAEFEHRFGTRKPLPYTTTTAFHVNLTIKDFETRRERLRFAKAVAQTQSFDRQRFLSLADFFKVSVSALAIRLWECGLIDE